MARLPLAAADGPRRRLDPDDLHGHELPGYDATYGYVARSLRLLRTAIGPDIPIHAAGGVANRMTADELKAFADAVADEGSVTGWSLYDFQTTGPKGWAALAPLGTGSR